jgi:hypothetical protein
MRMGYCIYNNTSMQARTTLLATVVFIGFTIDSA